MGRHNKAAKQRKAKAIDENKLPTAPLNNVEAIVARQEDRLREAVMANEMEIASGPIDDFKRIDSLGTQFKTTPESNINGTLKEEGSISWSLPDCCTYTSHGVICRNRGPIRVSQGERVMDNEQGTVKTYKYDEAMETQGHFYSVFHQDSIRVAGVYRHQASTSRVDTSNASMPLADYWKESGRANEVIKMEGAPCGWSLLANGDLSKFEEASAAIREQPSKLEGFQKPRVEGSNPAENKVYSGGCSKIGEVSSVVTLRPSKLEARQNPRVEGSNPVQNKVNGVGYSAQYHSRDLRTAGNGRGGIRGGGYGHQASESQVDDFTRNDSLARLLSSILRHQAAELGLDIRSDGYVFVKDLLKLRRRTHAGFPLSSHTVDDIKEVVRMDKKQRFGLLEENGQLLIRANQGHSIQTIKSEDLLSAVCFVEEVPVCVHGTYLRNLDAIQKEGLKRMGRNHVHFATGLLKEKSVISGMRSDCEVLIHLDVQKYLKDGMKLYRSENGVILAEGKNGVIPPNYFAKIQRLRS